MLLHEFITALTLIAFIAFANTLEISAGREAVAVAVDKK
jgi:hypothetical protein